MSCVICPLCLEKICDNICPMGFDEKNECTVCPRKCSVQKLNGAHDTSPNKSV